MVHATEPVQTVFNGLKYIITLFSFSPPSLHNVIESSDLFIHINTWNTLLFKTAGNRVFLAFKGGKRDHQL